jgi:uncharacterized protein (TIGR02246 family)
MHARNTWPAAFALTLCLAGCNPAPSPTTTAAPDTHDADLKAVHDTEAAWSQSFSTKDVDKVTSYYSDDASVYMPGTPVIKGMTAIKAGFKGMMADKNYSLSFTPDGGDVAKSGDVAYTHGTYTATSTDPKTKKVMHEKGKYLTIFKKQSDGTWKAIEDSISNDAPPTPAK